MDELEEQVQKDMNKQEEQAVQQEAYYYHCIAEFYGMLRVFGTKKVMEDLKLFKDSVEPQKETSPIILL